ncbi:hypothetical protein IC582_019785 [Cucumis melo]
MSMHYATRFFYLLSILGLCNVLFDYIILMSKRPTFINTMHVCPLSFSYFFTIHFSKCFK